MKKTKRLFGLFFLVFTLLAGSLSAFANSEIEEQYGISRSQIEESVEGWIGQLQMLSDEELKTLEEQMGDDMVTTWLSVSEGIGEFVEVLGDKAVYEITESGFIGEIPVTMENKEILVKIDYTAATGAVAIVFSEGKSEGGMGLVSILKKAGINTLIGMGTVFVMLIFISFLIWLLGFVPKLFSGKKEEKAALPAAESATAPVAEQIAERETAKADDQELVAVIAAAVAAATGTSTDSFVVRSIRKVKRS